MNPPITLIIEHPFFEYASWFCQIFVAITALVAIVVARSQLREMSDFRKQRLKILNATLLMELDKRWDSQEMSEARALFSSTRDEVDKAVGSKFPTANDGEKLQRISNEWTSRLSGMRDTKYSDYIQLLGICGFFETVGLMVKRQYISQIDVLDLFTQPIISVGRCFRGHIQERSKETSMPKGLFEHALRLSELALELDASKD